MIEISGKETISQLKQLILANNAQYEENDLKKLKKGELLNMIERYNAKVENNETPVFSDINYENPNVKILRQKTAELKLDFSLLSNQNLNSLNRELETLVASKVIRKNDVNLFFERAKELVSLYFKR